MANEKTQKLNKEMLQKYSWGRLAKSFYDNHQTDEAAWTLATIAKEGVDLGMSAEAYKKGLKGAVEIFDQKYNSILGDANIGEYLKVLGVKEDLGKTANIKFSELYQKVTDARYALDKKDSSEEEKLNAQKELAKYGTLQNLVNSSEIPFMRENRSKVEDLRQKDLVQRVLDFDKF